MTVTIEKETELELLNFDYEALANKVICFTLEHEQFPYEAEINLLLVDNNAIQEINKQYRDIDKSTDVLSFPLIAYEMPGTFDTIEFDDDNFNPDSGEAVLGDIIISVEKVQEQAVAYGHTLEREFAFLIVHSMLHLFGYDHMEADEAAFMEDRQKVILEKLQILR